MKVYHCNGCQRDVGGRGRPHGPGCANVPRKTSGTPRAARGKTRADGAPYSEGQPLRRFAPELVEAINTRRAGGASDQDLAAELLGRRRKIEPKSSK